MSVCLLWPTLLSCVSCFGYRKRVSVLRDFPPGRCLSSKREPGIRLKRSESRARIVVVIVSQARRKRSNSSRLSLAAWGRDGAFPYISERAICIILAFCIRLLSV